MLVEGENPPGKKRNTIIIYEQVNQGKYICWEEIVHLMTDKTERTDINQKKNLITH